MRMTRFPRRGALVSIVLLVAIGCSSERGEAPVDSNITLPTQTGAPPVGESDPAVVPAAAAADRSGGAGGCLNEPQTRCTDYVGERYAAESVKPLCHAQESTHVARGCPAITDAGPALGSCSLLPGDSRQLIYFYGVSLEASRISCQTLRGAWSDF